MVCGLPLQGDRGGPPAHRTSPSISDAAPHQQVRSSTRSPPHAFVAHPTASAFAWTIGAGSRGRHCCLSRSFRSARRHRRLCRVARWLVPAAALVVAGLAIAFCDIMENQPTWSCSGQDGWARLSTRPRPVGLHRAADPLQGTANGIRLEAVAAARHSLPCSSASSPACSHHTSGSPNARRRRADGRRDCGGPPAAAVLGDPRDGRLPGRIVDRPADHRGGRYRHHRACTRRASRGARKHGATFPVNGEVEPTAITKPGRSVAVP